MTNTTKEIINLLEVLPENEQILIKEIVKRTVIAWDSDFTKITEFEKESLLEAENDIINGDVYSQDDVLKILGLDK